MRSGLEDKMTVNQKERRASNSSQPSIQQGRKHVPLVPTHGVSKIPRGSNSDVGHLTTERPTNLWPISQAVTVTSGLQSYRWSYGYYAVILWYPIFRSPNRNVFFIFEYGGTIDISIFRFRGMVATAWRSWGRWSLDTRGPSTSCVKVTVGPISGHAGSLTGCHGQGVSGERCCLQQGYKVRKTLNQSII